MDPHESKLDPFTSKDRRTLFLEMCNREDGTSVLDVHRRAVELGDTATEEAYYNLARRLTHRGLIVSTQSEQGVRYELGISSDGEWLEEEDLISFVDPDYPLLALTIWKESLRQIQEIPESLWIELRERLRAEPAIELFFNAVVSYCDYLHAQVSDLAALLESGSSETALARQEAENTLRLLVGLAQYGLGLSRRAVNLPLTIDVAIADIREHQCYVDQEVLRAELGRRVEPTTFITDVELNRTDRPLLIGAVDGSTRGGVLSFLGEDGDLTVGYAPMISINTAIGQVNRSLRLRNKQTPLFIRLPEKPEDMQQRDNRYSIMAKLFYPDLSEAKYLHSVWNAMDLIEGRAALRLLRRWYGAGSNAEVQPADVVLRDGTVSPQDRDFSHYREMSSYGRIVRDMIDTNWEVVKKCKDDHQTTAGVIKTAQLLVFGPVINWFAAKLSSQKRGQLMAWPMQTLNTIPDQILLTRLLTAGRGRDDAWMRTCVLLRPFHAVTNYATSYSGDGPPSRVVMLRYENALRSAETERDERLFWETIFRPESDPFVNMMDNVFYGNFFLGAVPRLDSEKYLPRLEFLVPSTTSENSIEPWETAARHRQRLIKAIRQTGFQVSLEHSMFNSKAKVDVLPSLLIRAHDTVKLWATELLSRVQEYVGYYLARHVRNKKFHGVKVRPFTRDEFQLLYSQLKDERNLKAGVPKEGPVLDDED